MLRSVYTVLSMSFFAVGGVALVVVAVYERASVGILVAAVLFASAGVWILVQAVRELLGIARGGTANPNDGGWPMERPRPPQGNLFDVHVFGAFVRPRWTVHDCQFMIGWTTRGAAVGPRRQGAGPAARRDPPGPARRRHHDPLRHPRPGGGAGDRGPGRRDGTTGRLEQLAPPAELLRLPERHRSWASSSGSATGSRRASRAIPRMCSTPAWPCWPGRRPARAWPRWSGPQAGLTGRPIPNGHATIASVAFLGRVPARDGRRCPTGHWWSPSSPARPRCGWPIGERVRVEIAGGPVLVVGA